MKRHSCLAAMLALVSLAACKNESLDLAPDHGVVRALHAIPEVGVLTLTLDDADLGDFDFNQIRGINRPGDGNHEILIDASLPGDNNPTQRVESLNVATAVDRESTLVLNGTLDHTNVITWQQPARDWESEQADSDSAITVLEVSFGHASLSRGVLDFYLGAANFDPAASTPVASLDYSELQAKSEIESGTYELVVTPSGDPTTELYHSGALVLPAATSLLFVAYDSELLDDNGAPWLSVRSLGNNFSDLLTNQLIPGTIRVVHAARDTGPVDVITTDSQDVLISGLEFGDATPYVLAPTEATSFDVTGAGDPDDTKATFLAGGFPDSQHTQLIGGLPDALFAATIVDTPRRVVTEARFRVLEAATGVAAVDVYLVDPDQSIDDEFPTLFALTPQFGSPYIPKAGASYDLVLATPGTKDIIGGPVRVAFVNGGLYTAVITDATQDAHVSVVFIDDDPTH